MPSRYAVCLVAASLALMSGCVTMPADMGRGQVNAALEPRAGLPLAGPPAPGQIYVPGGADLAALDEDQAVLVALWNNAAFQEALVAMGLAHADLIQAGLLPNPEGWFVFRMPDKPYRYLVDFPLEALWLRPIRVRAASAFTEQESRRLAQLGLDLIRDTRQACADWHLALGALAVAREGARLRGEIARLVRARLEAGDIGRQEADTARIDALRAEQDVARAAYAVRLAEERLRNLLGVGGGACPLRLREPPPVPSPDDVCPLVEEALRSRPDLEAANFAVAAAEERLRLARLAWVRLLGVFDGSNGTRTGHEPGPGLRVTLPLFNFNEGGIARAEAEVEQLRRRRETIRQQIILDVRQAHFRAKQAAAELAILDKKVLPQAAAAIRRAEAAYKEGNTTYLIALETARQVLDSKLRRHQLVTELRRAWADLERSVARRLLQPEGKAP